MSKSGFMKLYIPAFAVAFLLLIINRFVDNHWLWGVSGIAIGVVLGLIIAFIFGDYKEA